MGWSSVFCCSWNSNAGGFKKGEFSPDGFVDTYAEWESSTNRDSNCDGFANAGTDGGTRRTAKSDTYSVADSNTKLIRNRFNKVVANACSARSAARTDHLLWFRTC